jgi:hypothetical protein
MYKNQAAILDGIRSLIVPHFTKLKRQCSFKIKLNDYWMNLHKH